MDAILTLTHSTRRVDALQCRGSLMANKAHAVIVPVVNER